MSFYRLPYTAMTQEAEGVIADHLNAQIGSSDLTKIVYAALVNWQDDLPEERLKAYADRYGNEAMGGDVPAKHITLPPKAADLIKTIGDQLEARKVSLLKVRHGYNIRLILVIAMLRYADGLKGQ